ncbi:DUF4037 domain-containing protein [Micromonospora sp. LOL_023]|uniref:DUF4037 domain-containing protein n=1 Tax=Micromonospora sp. LOL_023 TaxID=3345418 RepID=UPI003A8B103C
MSFLPGLELSRRFHHEVVAPVLTARFPGLRYAAARMDSGSELFGYDTPRSRDHDWGPRVQILLAGADAGLVDEVLAAVGRELPATFQGVPTRFAPDADRSLGVPACDGPRHGVTVLEVGDWCRRALGFDPLDGVGLLDWLAAPTQRLAEFTGGDVFHDGLPAGPACGTADPNQVGGLGVRRARLAWYPPDVWRYVLAGGWSRVAGEEPFVGRCGEVDDDVGGRVIAARLVRDLMRLTLLLDRRYPPYGKWLGTAFAGSSDHDGLATVLAGVLGAVDPRVRQRQLCRAYELVAVRTNRLGLAGPVEPTVRPFHDRPFLVLDAGRFVRALRGSIEEAGLRGLPLLGGVDQFVDHPALLTDAGWTRAVVSGALGLPPTPPTKRTLS